MFRPPSPLVLLVVFICHALLGRAKIINSRVSRVIQIHTNVARISTAFSFYREEDEVERDEYVVAVPLETIRKSAYMSVKSGKKSLELASAGEQHGYALYSVSLESFPAGEEIVLDFLQVYTEIIKPYPEEMYQLDEQLVLFQWTSQTPSPYRTELETTVVQTRDDAIEDFTGTHPITLDSTNVVLGPYEHLEPFSVGDPLTVHYVNHAPFAKAVSCLREIEVSHWGNIAVEEMYDLLHHGAKLKGGFSRMDYYGKRQQYKENASFRELIAVLPSGAHDIYYRDQIGNVSTSVVRPSKQGVELAIATRYPMFGGWKTSWYQGYNLGADEGLSRDGSTYRLSMKFGMPFPSLWADELIVKVILPEGARVVSVSMPFEAEASETIRYTYLDTSLLGGRPVVVVKKRNVVAEHNTKFQVTYTFNGSAIWIEPFLMALVIFIFFVLYMLVSRADLSIRHAIMRKPSKIE